MPLDFHRIPSALMPGAGLLALAAIALAAPCAAALEIEWVTVGDPGNAADPDPATENCDALSSFPCGAVSYPYQIGKYEVTVAEYAEFLNAVAALDDPNDLYNFRIIGTSLIGRTWSDGSWTYTAAAGRELEPNPYVPFYDALRFANWLHNGQPIGEQDDTTTEDGAYTIAPAGMQNNSIRRNLDAVVFLPNEHEWYKAAYYDPTSMSYFDYPAGSDTPTFCTGPTPNPNSANCNSPSRLPKDVGSYTGSASPNGTFDQGGNVWEWNESVVLEDPDSYRGWRGGSYSPGGAVLGAAWAASRDPLGGPPNDGGFRVATVPEPDAWLLGVTALLGVAGIRRIRA